MRIRCLAVWLGVLALGFAGSGVSVSQSLPTATQAIDISVFGAGTGTFTELGGGKNTGVTAGLDVTFRNYFHVRPSLELRGTFAVDSGSVVGLTDGMVGLRMQKDYARFHPYLDVLYGRGALNYQNGGIVIGNFRYDRTTTNVYAGGAGLDVRLTRQISGKADVQFERWNTPVTDTGVIYPIPVSLGLVYRFDFNRYGHKVKRSKVRGDAGSASTAP